MNNLYHSSPQQAEGYSGILLQPQERYGSLGDLYKHLQFSNKLSYTISEKENTRHLNQILKLN